MHPVHFLSHWNAEILALANLFIALGTVVLAAGIPWSIAVSRRDQRDTFYATLDQTYFEIQKLIIENPHLGKVGHEGKTPEQIAQYDAFAFMTWNFVNRFTTMRFWATTMCFATHGNAFFATKRGVTRRGSRSRGTTTSLKKDFESGSCARNA